jgi:hypothetical protein
VERPNVLTGDSFFHLSALGSPLEGLNLCGAGRVVCLIDPVGDVYACRGGCMAAKFFTGLELTDPDPECVFGHGETALAKKALASLPATSPDHSRRVSISPR